MKVAFQTTKGDNLLSAAHKRSGALIDCDEWRNPAGVYVEMVQTALDHQSHRAQPLIGTMDSKVHTIVADRILMEAERRMKAAPPVSCGCVERSKAIAALIHSLKAQGEPLSAWWEPHEEVSFEEAKSALLEGVESMRAKQRCLEEEYDSAADQHFALLQNGCFRQSPQLLALERRLDGLKGLMMDGLDEIIHEKRYIERFGLYADEEDD